MARQYRIVRKITTVPITAGQFSLFDLPRSYDYESLFLRINASLQVTVAATSVRAEAPVQLVPRIEVITEGKNTIYSAPFWFASFGNYGRPITEAGARATTPPSAVGVATYAVEAIGIADFMTPDGRRPKDTNLRTRSFSLFQCRLTYGQPGDPFVGGTVVFSGAPTVDVFSAELVEETDDKGNFIGAPAALKKISYVQAAIPASNNNFQQRLPAGNLIRSVLLRGEGSVTAGEPATNVFNNIILQSGTDVRLNLAAANLRAKNNADYGQITAGYYVADLLSKGLHPVDLTELWDVTRQAEPLAVLDITGGANVVFQAVVTEFIFPG
ncbi:MAG TPA: hypothetical protein VEM38_13280 [Burkholderiales bacterium]|nr:hypothetical protein [Burkholderiales bacterium]